MFPSIPVKYKSKEIFFPRFQEMLIDTIANEFPLKIPTPPNKSNVGLHFDIQGFAPIA